MKSLTDLLLFEHFNISDSNARYITQNITRETSNIEERNFSGNNNPNPPRVYLACTQETA